MKQKKKTSQIYLTDYQKIFSNNLKQHLTLKTSFNNYSNEVSRSCCKEKWIII